MRFGFLFCVQYLMKWETSDNPTKRPRASFTRVCLRTRFYLTCVGTEICTVTANTKIITSTSLSTARHCHPVTCSECHLEKPCNVALFPHFPPFIWHNACFLLFQKLCQHNCLKPSCLKPTVDLANLKQKHMNIIMWLGFLFSL